MSSDISLLVGAGPAGITAALQARELGARVTLLEAGQVGGTSLNRGPAPVRTLARAARLARDWSSWATFGLEGPPPVPNLPAVVANSERVARYAHDKKDIAAISAGTGSTCWRTRPAGSSIRTPSLLTGGEPVRGPHHPGRRRARQPPRSPAPTSRSRTRTFHPWTASPAGSRSSAAPNRLSDRVHFR